MHRQHTLKILLPILLVCAAGWLESQTFVWMPISQCSSGASPAVCGTQSIGSVAIPVCASPPCTVQVNTTALGNSNPPIFLTPDGSTAIGTKLSVTCNTTAANLTSGVYVVSRTSASFTIATNLAVAVNPECVNFWVAPVN